MLEGKKNFYKHRKKILLSSLLLLSGCLSLSEKEKKEHLFSSPSLKHSLEDAAACPFFSVGSWPSQNWWEIFQSEELSSLVLAAIQNNPNLQSFESKIQAAKERAIVVREKIFPLIYFDAQDTQAHLSKNGLYRAFNPNLTLNPTLIDLSLSFTYEFDFWSKNRNLFNAALGKAKADEAEAEEVKLLTTTSTAQVYFALKINKLKQKLYQELFAVKSHYAKVQKELQNSFLISKLPFLLSEEKVNEAKELLDRIEEEIEVNTHQLNILLGKGPDTPLDLSADLPKLPQSLEIPENLSLDLLARRPDLMAQIWRVEAIAYEVGAAKADFFPNINLAALAGLESTLASSLFQSNSMTAQASPALHLPIFTAGSIRANIRAKKALFDEAIFAYNHLLLQSAQQIADLISLGKSVFSQKLSQESVVTSAQERLDLTALRFSSGLDSVLEKDLLHEELIEKELKNLDLLYDKYVITLKLIKALGGGYKAFDENFLKKEASS